MDYFSFYFVPETGEIQGNGLLHWRKKFLFIGIEDTTKITYFLDCQNNLAIRKGGTTYLFPNIRRENMKKTLNWFATQSREELSAYKKWGVRPARKKERQKEIPISYLFHEHGVISGNSICYRRGKFDYGEMDICVGMAFVYWPDDSLRVTIDHDHYLIQDVKRECLESTLVWFAKQKYEDVEPYKTPKEAQPVVTEIHKKQGYVRKRRTERNKADQVDRKEQRETEELLKTEEALRLAEQEKKEEERKLAELQKAEDERRKNAELAELLKKEEALRLAEQEKKKKNASLPNSRKRKTSVERTQRHFCILTHLMIIHYMYIKE